MKVDKMKKEDLELLSNKDITNLILEESKKPINTKNLFEKIIKLLELPESTLQNKIGDYYTSLATDKRFILLEDGCWDLKSRYTSDKIIKSSEEDDEDEEYEEEMEEEIEDESEEDNYSDNDDSFGDDTDDDYKDLLVMDEDELELEQ